MNIFKNSINEKSKSGKLVLSLTNTDDVYIGASCWKNNEIANQIVAEGIISIVNTEDTYEIVNLGNQTFYLNSFYKI